jgi:hypothetical protein
VSDITYEYPNQTVICQFLICPDSLFKWYSDASLIIIAFYAQAGSGCDTAFSYSLIIFKGFAIDENHILLIFEVGKYGKLDNASSWFFENEK